MNPILKKIILVVIFLSFTLASENIYAQAVASKNAIKAEMTVRFLNYVFWENEKNIDAFKIAFYGNEPAYFQHLKKSISNRKVRDKPLILVPIRKIEDMAEFHMLVVASNSNQPFSDIALKARGTNTLVVSEQSENQIHMMVNFLQSNENTLSFEVNKSNILLEDISISDDILLIGGTELDVATLYREIEVQFSNLINEFDLTKEKSVLANIELSRNQELLSKAQKELSETSRNLKTVNNTLLLQKTTITDQETAIGEQNTLIAAQMQNLADAVASANQNRNTLRAQAEQLNESSDKIRTQEQRVKSNNFLLQKQQDRLADLTENTSLQSDIIRDQKQLLYVSVIALSIFVILVFWLYRTSQDRARISRELFKRGEALEEEVKDRTAAAVASEIHFRALSESSPVGVYQTDINGNCSYVNERWCEYSGLTREQAVGLGWLNAMHPDDRAQMTHPSEPNLQTDPIFNAEHRYCSPTGEERWLVGRCEIERDINGDPQGFIGTVTDITDHKSLQEQVRRTQKMDALGLLTGGIAHDYNNMLAIIIGYAELLQFKLDDQPELLNYADQIAHASNRGATLTKKLLSFSKNSPSDARQLDVNKILTHQFQMLEKTLTPRIILKLELGENLWPVFLDEGELEDALVNISINAMHAMDRGGTLTIQTRNVGIEDLNHPMLKKNPGDYVLLSFSDTGCGMDENSIKKIFDPFYSTKGSQGTGLGLTQVYSFTERSNGVITVDSVLDAGTNISMYFPRHSKQRNVEPAMSDLETDDSRGTETILVVDDEIALLELASEILTSEGYLAICVNDAKQALLTLETTAVDLLLSDVVMPDIDGYQLARTVEDMYPSVKIQLVSGFNDEKQEHNVNSILKRNLLQKPYRSKVLLDRVRRLLDNERLN